MSVASRLNQTKVVPTLQMRLIGSVGKQVLWHLLYAAEPTAGLKDIAWGVRISSARKSGAYVGGRP